MNELEKDFGSYLLNVEERDVDLLLMEEFHVSKSFVEWFCRQNCLEGEVVFDGAWHSIFNDQGETDLLLRVHANGKRVGILIENKIAAPEQPEQDERYHIRGVRLQQEKKVDTFLTCICAPQSYLDGLGSSSLYHYRISYEAIAKWFAALEDPRNCWRRQIIEEAIQQGRRGYKMIVNQTVSEFHMAYWEYLRRHHPKIVMAKPTPKGSKSNWIILKGRDFPKGVRFHHKIDQRVLELGFNGHDVSELLAVKADWPDQMIHVQKGGVAAITIDVPEIDMTKGIVAQKESLERVFAAAYQLFPYANLLTARDAVSSLKR
jgi:hypothetical protein